MNAIGWAACIISALTACAAPVSAQSVSDPFYSGKTIKMLVGAEVGSGTDLRARSFAKYYAKKIAGNPIIIVENMAGAGGLVAAASLQNIQPRNGLLIAALQRGNLLEPLLRNKKDLFDPIKVNWLGSLNKDTNVVVSWYTSPIKTLDDLKTKEFVVGASGGGADSLTYPLLLNNILGAKLKIVRGYAGGASLDLAMERGEIEGRASVTWATLRSEHAQWLKDKKVNVVAQFALERNPELPDVPNVLERVTDPQNKQMLELLFSQQEAGRPFAAPPDVPVDLLRTLRNAFIEATKDSDFLAEAKSRGGSVEAISGEEIYRLLDKAYRTPPAILAAARATLDAK
jgi:tripartite-type tricarboxylate transporter receptor subunit TctC